MSDEIKMIPIDRIRILNPRHRDLKKFDVIIPVSYTHLEHSPGFLGFQSF